VGAAQQADVGDAVVAAQGERVPVVILESVALRTTPALNVDVTAPASVSSMDGPTHSGRNAPGTRGGVDGHELLARSAGPAEATGFQSL